MLRDPVLYSFWHIREPGHRKMSLTQRKSLLSNSSQSQGSPDGSDSKEFACSEGDLDLIPGSESSPGKENGY